MEREGVPEELMNRFYSLGEEAGDFGTTRARAESDKYDTIALVVDQEVAGSADVINCDGEVEMQGCYILPEYRGKLKRNGRSAFEHMAAARLNRTDLPVRTSATTAHGKTQHVYNKLGFSPYELKLPDSENDKTHVMMADKHKYRRFDRELYMPDSIEGFLEYVSTGFDQEIKLREGSYDGIEISSSGVELEQNHSLFEAGSGDQSLDTVVNQILGAKQGSANLRVDVQAEDPSAYELTSELLENEFIPSAFKPIVKGGQKRQSVVVQLAYSSEPIEAELIPETRDFLGEAGWNIETINRKEKSEEVRLKS